GRREAPPLQPEELIMFANKLVVTLTASAALSISARADEGWASRDYDFANRQMNDFVSRFERDLVDPVSRGVRAGRKPVKTAGSATLVPDRVSDVPKLMAEVYPERERARMESTFRELLAGYRKIEHHFGLPRNDVAGAVAAFIAGCHMGYRNVDFPDA